MLAGLQLWLGCAMRDVLELLLLGGFMIVMLGAVHAHQRRAKEAKAGVVRCPRCGELMGKLLARKRKRCRECGGAMRG
ncbi:hypothetical protein KS4_36640 [Poriferisphaera corsica]|uniref:Uncharacterized protein n=1 Tax=Poriferisphaera corsica TaxID=2528020 RepID=A0A517YZD4_9BACT|nr:hypothetical protein [Poriferisphaera corsica]QDU35581.1 hypothetical protein KS4_36640 [Poriferisphaera corsica]